MHSSVKTSYPNLWRRIFAFAGPAYLVAVGYMDPGNWATDIEGGARFGYQLLWVLVLSNAMAVLLQTLSARLGIVSGLDLAQACRAAYPKSITRLLWILCELAIAACDLAEVLGAAIGLNLLLHIPLLVGVIVTAFDTLLMLWFNRMGIRMMESIILSFVSIIAACFFIEIFLAKPDIAQVAAGIVPRINRDSLYVAIGILGATVMPHNLYLHSALVQTRRIGPDDDAKRTACKYNLIDSVIALNGALLVNAAILVMAGATFFQRGIVVTEIQQAHKMLEPLLGTSMAGAAFAIALICSGQSSTITGTMAGQIVMEGFLNFRMRPWLRRLLTRSVAVIPAVLTIVYAGEEATYKLLIFSQVILSLQLPFAVVPLIHFTSNRRWMGNFANRLWVQVLAWLCAVIIIGLNAWLVWSALGDWMKDRPEWTWPLLALVLAIGALLVWVGIEPWLYPRQKPDGVTADASPATAAPLMDIQLPGPNLAPAYRRILVTLDHSRLDAIALIHASALARAHQSKLYLLHVEEGVLSRLYGSLSSTAEVEAGRHYLDSILSQLHAQDIDAELEVVHSGSAKTEIVRLARQVNPDLIVMGAHGHRGLKDIIFGATINEVRHAVGVPVLIVREPEP